MADIAIIVNADDLGMSAAVNEATCDLISKGRVSSATLLANAPATRDAARRAAAFPGCSFGVHLNLTQFEPLTGGPGARLLVDDRGQMTRANETAPPTAARLMAIYDEACAQVERVAAFGVRVSHVDSHNHIHTRPFFFPILKMVQRRYGIRRVRLSKTFYATAQPCPPRLIWRKRAYNRALKSVYRTGTAGAFTEFLTYYHAEPARKRSVGCVELMVHPGAEGAGAETAALDGDWLARAGLPARLVPYTHIR
jgi:predicted glycoside hydrolase/deacetylase ChbG (UPF0249 family)